ncbi:unnamed protein product [Protopolystoma xenopodis]|uniref:Uncharacterized protein n=1 Tax=Protopolystoma xenopodis TaxID=117903 RepID=A0A3S5FFC2_9PLAT|nr:unnamed protein product [Protopolystoma xenopodis]
MLSDVIRIHVANVPQDKRTLCPEPLSSRQVGQSDGEAGDCVIYSSGAQKCQPHSGQDWVSRKAITDPGCVKYLFKSAFAHMGNQKRAGGGHG